MRLEENGLVYRLDAAGLTSRLEVVKLGKLGYC